MKINKQKLKNAACVAATLVMVAYLAGALVITDRAQASARCEGMRIEVRDTGNPTFVTAREIARELGGLAERSSGMLLRDINTEEIARRLGEIDKIESATVTLLSDRRINVTVTPLVPVARIFDGDKSYYINRQGKRIGANARYHVDVPVITGHFDPADTVFTPGSLLPLLDWLDAHAKTWGRFVTMIKVDSPRDIIVIPPITGHVVNLGAPKDFDNKFERLRTMYSKVIPVRGWDFYDTLSVKWSGQVVATRREKPAAEDLGPVDDEDETTDVSTMLAAEGVAPGRTRPGQKAHSEKPIPAAVRDTPKKSSDEAKTDGKKTTEKDSDKKTDKKTEKKSDKKSEKKSDRNSDRKTDKKKTN